LDHVILDVEELAFATIRINPENALCGDYRFDGSLPVDAAVSNGFYPVPGGQGEENFNFGS
jgi:hypothetical protein